MTLPQNTAKIIEFLRPGIDPIFGFSVFSDASGVISIGDYNGSGIVPTEQELIDAESDLTVVNGQTFTQWHDENGANPIITKRKRVKDRSDASTVDGVELRSLIQLMNKRDNYLTNRVIELQDRVQAMLDSVGDADNMRTAGLGVPISTTSARTLLDAKQDYKDNIDAGAAD